MIAPHATFPVKQKKKNGARGKCKATHSPCNFIRAHWSGTPPWNKFLLRSLQHGNRVKFSFSTILLHGSCYCCFLTAKASCKHERGPVADNSQLEKVGEFGEVRRKLAGEVLLLQKSAYITMVSNPSPDFVGSRN